ncbi:MAG: hypothetical protein NTY48_01600 [Candidatus Diapherotrites archaeon]|nr:hypothetical protein [Candidatus Diapherotrites archaeon]
MQIKKKLLLGGPNQKLWKRVSLHLRFWKNRGSRIEQLSEKLEKDRPQEQLRKLSPIILTDELSAMARERTKKARELLAERAKRKRK